MYGAIVDLVCGLCCCVVGVWFWVACMLEVVEVVVAVFVFARDEVWAGRVR